jgi:hypothetical protein
LPKPDFGAIFWQRKQSLHRESLLHVLMTIFSDFSPLFSKKWPTLKAM